MLVLNITTSYNSSILAIIRLEINLKSDPWPQVSENAKDLMRKLLDPFPLRRPTIQEIPSNVASSMDIKEKMACGQVCSFEREIIDIDRLSRNIQEVKEVVLVKQKEYKSLRCSISNFTSSLGYFQQCEAQAKARTNIASSYLVSKKKELTRLLTIKEDTERAQLKIKQSEVKLKNNIATIKLKIKEENKKREKDTVRLAIDNVEWQSSGKATELLKSEEEKTKLQLQMNHESEKLKIIKKESDKLGRKLHDLDQETQTVEVEIQKCIKSTEEMENKVQSKLEEKDAVL
ncbi:kinesin-like protein KIN-12E [Tanacetum coccineum]